MEKDVTVPPETFRKHVDACLTPVNRVLKQMSRLFLVEDLVDSLKVSGSNYKYYDLKREFTKKKSFLSEFIYLLVVQNMYGFLMYDLIYHVHIGPFHTVYSDFQASKIARGNKEHLFLTIFLFS